MNEKLVDTTKNTRKLREREAQNAVSKSVSVLPEHKPRSQPVNATKGGSSKEDCITIESSLSSEDADEDDEGQVVDVKPSVVKEKSAASFEVVSRLRPKNLRHSDQTIRDIQLSKPDVLQRQHPYRRSKRNIVPKKEVEYGLLWKEEAELQRALNASIQARRQKEQPNLISRDISSSSQSVVSTSQKTVECQSKNSLLDSDAGGDDITKDGGECEMADEDYGQNFTFIGSDSCLSNKHRKTRVRAQRKFASSSSPLEILNYMPNKWTNCQSQKVVNTNGKTEDFLTFLCLRRSSLLPPHLECFKYGESDSLQSFPSSSPASRGSSCPGTPVSLPGPSGENSCISTPNPDNGTKALSFQRNLFKQSELKESKRKLLPSQNSSKFHSFQSYGWTRKRTTEQAIAIKNCLKRKNEISKVDYTNALHRSSSDSRLHQRLAFRHGICKSNVASLKSSPETAKISSVRTKATSEESLKSRLRATTQALSAAVIKEQQMFARKSAKKYNIEVNEEGESDFGMDPEKKSEARLTRSNLLNLEKNRTGSSSYSNNLQTPKKSRAQLSVEADLSRSLALSQQAAGTKEFDRDGDECHGCKTSFSSSSGSSSASSGPNNIQPVSIPHSPTFHPTVDQLQDFAAYVNECSKTALDYGLCRIIPPEGWKMNCNISQEARFTPLTQYIHRMTHRWGPNVQHLTCIMHHIESQGGSLEHIPLLGGVETDMVALSHAVQSCGGIQQVIEKNKWPKVAEMIRIPSVAKEKTRRLYEIYCRYLLSYDTLSADEKKKLEEKVLSKRDKDPATFDQPCVTKSRAKSLSEFFCVARNLQSMYFDEDPLPMEVQREYWQLTQDRAYHVAVQLGHIDSSQCSGTRSNLTRKKDAAAAKDEQNLKTVVRSHRSVLDHLPSISGVTESVLDIGMLFSTLCWTQDPHLLPCVYYLHTGSDVIWYSVPVSEEARLKSVMQHLVPDLIESNLSSWLPTDSVMISPEVLHRHQIRVFHTVQQQGQLIVVFPESFVANICCGYNIMEHINFTFSSDWLRLGCRAAQILEESCEPEMFSMEKLLVDLVMKEETLVEELKVALPLLDEIIVKELNLRRQLVELGLKSRHLNAGSAESSSTAAVESRRKSTSGDPGDTHDLHRCDVSEKLCYLSMVFNEQNDVSYSLGQAVSRLKRRKNLSSFVLLYRFDEVELNEIIEKGWMRISGKRRTPSKRNATAARKRLNSTSVATAASPRFSGISISRSLSLSCFVG